MIMDRHIRESNLIEGIDNPAADRRARWAWKYLREQRTITKEVLLETHRRITYTQLPKGESGHYRRVQVYVGNHKPPGSLLVPILMTEWMEKLLINQNALDPIQMHIEFETIHPFIDGNGRTGRMLLWWHELQIGRAPTLFRNSEKHEKYYPLFNRDKDLPVWM